MASWARKLGLAEVDKVVVVVVVIVVVVPSVVVLAKRFPPER